MYSTSLEIHKEINSKQSEFAVKAPSVKSGSQAEIQNVLSTLKIKNFSADLKAEWVSSLMVDSASIKLLSQKIEKDLKKNLVPDLTGMTARDVLFLLENNGIRVQLIGSGSVATQSIRAGTVFTKGTQIILQLI